MKAIKLGGLYLKWHYSGAFRDMLRIFRDFLWFLFNFFSISLLAKTLFYPWKRLHEEKSRGFNLKDSSGIFIVNTLMRVVGFFARAFVIIAGLASVTAALFLSVLAILVWTILPALLIAILFIGFSNILK